MEGGASKGNIRVSGFHCSWGRGPIIQLNTFLGSECLQMGLELSPGLRAGKNKISQGNLKKGIVCL